MPRICAAVGTTFAYMAIAIFLNVRYGEKRVSRGENPDRGGTRRVPPRSQRLSRLMRP